MCLIYIGTETHTQWCIYYTYVILYMYDDCVYDVYFFKKQNSISIVTMKFTVRTRILHSVFDNDRVGGFDYIWFII